MKAAFLVMASTSSGILQLAGVTSRPDQILEGRPILGFPGGHVEEGEEPIDAAIREAWEEGYEMVDKSLVNPHPIHYDPAVTSSRSGKTYEVYWFLAIVEPKMLPDAERQERGIFPVITLPEAFIGMGNEEVVAKVKHLMHTLELVKVPVFNPVS